VFDTVALIGRVDVRLIPLGLERPRLEDKRGKIFAMGALSVGKQVQMMLVLTSRPRQRLVLA
jgi:hypothetical protein